MSKVLTPTQPDVKTRGLPDFANRNRQLEWRSRWFHLTRTDDDLMLERIRDRALSHKRDLIAKQRKTADHKAAYNPAGAGSPWYSVGPRNINGRVRSLAVDPGNPDLVYCGAASGGVWKTTDGGQVWRPLWDTQESLAVGALAIAASNSNVIYAGTGEGLIAGTYGSGHNFPGAGVYVSTDGGATWARRATVTNRRITQVVVAQDDPQRVYVSGLAGFERSTDGGLTWTTLTTGQVSDAVMDPSNSSVLYIAVHADGVYKSTDQGTTFTKLANAPTGTSAQWPKLAIGVSGVNGSNLLLVRSAGTISRSTDAGATFSTVAGTHGSSWLGWSDLIAVAPDDESVILWGGVNLERTANGGTSWTTLSGLHSDQHQAIFAPSNPNIVYEGNDGGLYRSADKGATWTEVSHGLVISQFYNLGDWNPISNVLGGGTQDQGTNMTTGGLTWKNILGWDGGYLVIDFTDPHVMYAEHQSTDIQKSTDGGQTWVGKTAGLSGFSPWVGVLTMDPNDHNKLYTGKSGVFRSLDALATAWSASSQDFGVDVSAITVAPSDSNRVYAGTGDLYFRTGQGKVFRSNDGGATSPWTEITGTLPSSRPVTAISVDRTNADRVVVAYGGSGAGPAANAIFLTTNGGNTWTDISGDLPNVSVNGVAFDPNTTNTIYVATDTGIYRTINLGANWLAFDNGIPNAVVTDLVLDPARNMLYASTFGRGMYKLDITPGLVKPEVDLYMRDDILDTGERLPSPSGYPDPNNVANTVYWWESPDIKINNPPYYVPAGVFDGIDFDETLAHQDPQRTKLNRFYVQVHNRGWRSTSNVSVRAFVADASAGLPNLPNALTPPNFNLSSTADWQPIGSAQTIPTLEPNRPVILTWDYLIPASTATHSCVLAVVSSSDDPMTNPETNVNILVNTEKRVCLKNLHVIDAMGPEPGPVLLALDFHNAEDVEDLVDIVVEPRNFQLGTIGMLLPRVTFEKRAAAFRGVTVYALREGEYLGEWYATGNGATKALARNLEHVERSLIYDFDATKPSEIRGIRLKPKQTIRAIIACRGAGAVGYGTTQSFAVLQRQKGKVVGGGTFEVRLRRAAGMHPVSHIRISLDGIDRGRAGAKIEHTLERGRVRVYAAFNGDRCRTYERTLDAERGHRERSTEDDCLFDGYVAEEDRLTVSFSIRDGERAARLNHVRSFAGPPETWVGSHQDVTQEGLGIRYRIESLPLGAATTAD